jgi:hypothetical protein
MAMTWSGENKDLYGAAGKTSVNPAYTEHKAKVKSNRAYEVIMGMQGRSAPPDQLKQKLRYDTKTGKVMVGYEQVQSPQKTNVHNIWGNQPTTNSIISQIGWTRPTQYNTEFEGIKLDPASLSGKAEGDLSFRDDGGVPLAVFTQGKNEVGYMRLATQQGKTPDSLALGNSNGLKPGASSKSLLGGAR